MKKTFLLRTNPWIFTVIGVLFLMNGITRFFRIEELSGMEYGLMVLNFGAGIYALLFTIIVLTDWLGTAPKVVVFNEGVLMKSKALASGRQIAWSEIKAITFHSYQIDFKLETEPVFFNYRSSANTSKKIKDAIRDMAELKEIPITGG